MGVFSNNRPNIVPGALISSSYVSDLYDLLSGQKPENFILSGSLLATGSLQGTASFALNATSASRATSASFATNAAISTLASTVSVQNTIGTGTYFLAMVDSQNVDAAAAEIVNTQDLSYNGFTGVLSFANGTGIVEATATNAVSASRAMSSSRATSASYALNAAGANLASNVVVDLIGIPDYTYYLPMMTNGDVGFEFNVNPDRRLVHTNISKRNDLITINENLTVTGNLNATASRATSASYALTASYALNAAGSTPDWNTIYTAATGRVRYVSPSGSNSNDGLSSVKPLNTLYAAKVSSSAGDIVYVAAGLYEFDNRSSAYLWNGRTAEVNLWKNGVTYYFEPGAKILFRNGGSSSQTLTLFNPGTSTGETCTVLGELEFQGDGEGSDAGGKTIFFNASSDNGYTFFAKVNKLTCNQTELITITKSSVAGTIGKFTLIADEETWGYTGGQTGAGSLYFIAGAGSDSVLQFESHITKRNYQFRYNVLSLGWAYQIRSTFSPSTYITIAGDTLVNLQKPLTRFRDTIVKNVNININRIYFDRSYATDVSSIITDPYGASNNYVLNMNADLIDLEENSYSDNIFSITAPNGTINFNGNIFTKSTGGGRCILNFNNFYGAKGTAYNNQFNMVGNIYLLGSADNASELFYNVGGVNTVNFTGRIYGKFYYLANINSGGTMNINNSNIESTSTFGLMCLHNADSTRSTLRISNSNIKMANTSYMSDSRHYNMLINNSNIVNTSTGHTLYNPLNTGILQLLNSTVYAHSSSLAINYTSSIIAGNTIINTAYSGSLTGSLTTLTEMIS